MTQRKNNIVFGWFIAFLIMVLIWLNSPENPKTDFSIINFSMETSSISYIGNTENAPKERNHLLNYKTPKIHNLSYRIQSHFGATNKTETNTDYYSSNHFEATYDVPINEEPNNQIHSTNSNTTLSDFSNQNITYSSNKRNKEVGNNYGQITRFLSDISNIKGLGSIKNEKNATELVGSKHGFLSLSTDLSSIESFTSANNIELQKTSNIDPGGGDDMGEPIPVGDGWLFSIVLVVGYACLKRISNKIVKPLSIKKQK